MLKISHSSLKTFQTCPMSYFFRYRLGRVPITEPVAFTIGKVAHEATSMIWSEGRDAAREYLLEVSQSDVDPVELARLVAALEVYSPPMDDFEVIAHEAPFEFRPSGMRGVRIRGFADSLLREKRTGKLFVREYKTTASEIIGFGPFWGRVTVDAQVTIYKHAFGADGIVYDVTRKPGLRPSRADGVGRLETEEIMKNFFDRVVEKVKESPQEFYQWRTIYKSNAETSAEMDRILDGVRMLRQSIRNDWWPRHSHSCVGFGRCRYLDVCSGQADIFDDELFEPYESR